ncbi:hypothetical protein IWT25_00711 [Secundilactobacillus pentosiphilus]|uniref:Uncharacterized protein n=1 Tax=Secundilactobacillus pentosiphilus TaxID=1714682 RepID=A0A1Z5IUI6_9LACO|nr:hypothetical protein [Secundilactobacillus pentosiphilus]GAX05407.1 hypothetical protein IWT25_00711 [Secundilactobacillus pentosiphilus]
MTREEKIQYVALNSNHSVDFIRQVAARNEDNLDLMVTVTDGQVKQNLEEQAISMS